MLQTAIDLSKQWPQAISRIGFGSAFILLAGPEGWPTRFSTEMEKVAGDGQFALIAVAINTSFILGFIYILGSLLIALGDAVISSRDQSELVPLAAAVFKTGNGLLINEFQETRRSSQLFGGAFSCTVLGGFASWATSLLSDDPSSVFSPYLKLGSLFNDNVFAKLIGFTISILLFLYLIKSVRTLTAKRYVAIEIEIVRHHEGKELLEK